MRTTEENASPEFSGRGIADLPSALGFAAFEEVERGVFRPVGTLPAWLSLPDGNVDLADRFPLLEIFLPECELDWKGVSDIWTEQSESGGEYYVQAVAAQINGRRFLVLKTLPEALYTWQQLAHDLELEKEKVERLSRELEIKRQEAEHATQAKSKFLAQMSHEIRTPLNAVIGMADVLAATELTLEQRRCVDVSQRNGIGLLNLINDILDLSKVEAGKVELEAVRFDLREIIARAIETVEPRAAAKGLWLRCTVASGVPVCLVGDPNRLRQVLINLLGNSIKFTEQGGVEVRVETDSEDQQSGRVGFCISDTGIGIEADKIDSVFESFTQADSSTTRRFGGTGLGLTISKQLVELMGGRIWVDSTVGSGSAFFFTVVLGLPEGQEVAPGRLDEQPDRSGARTEPAIEPSTLESLEARVSGMRILLADDSEDNRFLILSYLKRTGSRIDIAENGAAAVDLFRANQYDVVLMDVEMPVMDGYMATRAIRELERTRAATPTPVLALTAHAFADMGKKGMTAGFTALLTKPIRSVDLLEGLVSHRGTLPEGPPAPVVRVLVEEGMEDVVPKYLEKRRGEISLYRDALAKNDMETIRMMGHRMKGTGTGYGFPALTEIGGALEQAAKQGARLEIETKLSEFVRYLLSVELEYK